MIRVKDSFNSYPIDRFAEAGAIAALQDEAYFEQTRQQVMASRAQLVADLQGMGFEVLPSGANFIFARHPLHAGEQLAAALREHAVIVRHFKKPAKIADFLRITIGDALQNEALTTALKVVLTA